MLPDNEESFKKIELVLRTCIEALVDYPEKVELNRSSATKSTSCIIEVSVDDSDIGKIIGKEGKIARSLRTIATSIAAKEGVLIHLDIYDPNKRMSVK